MCQRTTLAPTEKGEPGEGAPKSDKPALPQQQVLYFLQHELEAAREEAAEARGEAEASAVRCPSPRTQAFGAHHPEGAVSLLMR